MPQFPSTTTASGIWTLKDQRIAQQGGNWPLLVVPLQYRNDPYAASLFTAVTFSSSANSLTGGAYVDVSPQIRSAQGLTPGTAKTLATIGNGTMTAATVGAPQSRYSNVYTFVNATSQNDIPHYAGLALNSGGNLTVEMWAYEPVGRSFGYIYTNNFSGGYYQGWGIGNSPSSVSPPRRIVYSTNYGAHLNSPENVVPQGVWYHVAFVFANGNLTMYINGTSVAAGTGNGANSQTTISFGGTNWDGITSAQNRQGIQMADLRIYTVAKYTQNFYIDISDTTRGGSITT
jgi:hypothetical protein